MKTIHKINEENEHIRRVKTIKETMRNCEVNDEKTINRENLVEDEEIKGNEKLLE